MIAALGLENVIIIETSDAVLVTNRGKDEEIKKLRAEYDKKHGIDEEVAPI